LGARGVDASARRAGGANGARVSFRSKTSKEAMNRNVALIAALAVLAGGPAAAQELVRPIPTQPGQPAAEGEASDDPMGEEGYIEVVVDEEGRIYERRHYGGIIPDVRDRFAAGLKAGKLSGKKPAITWVGFQQRSLFSRVFIQTDQVTAYTIYKPDPLHIVVDFPNTAIPVENDRRMLDTSKFDSPVEGVDARVNRGKGYSGARVTITLDSPTGYLYKQEGSYVFIDIER
jgi:hypothetical protein